jgi:hypothetical protein
MAGRRQVWTGITLFVLTVALTASQGLGAALSRPTSGWEAVTVVAAALLLAVCARRPRAVPAPAPSGRATGGPAANLAPVLSRLSPDAPGRPQQPRAPGRAIPAR